MKIRSFQFALPVLFVLIASTFVCTNARAQYGDRQCLSLTDQLNQAMSDNKRQISLARQYLTYCVRLKSDLAFGLWILSDALNGDNQHEEALAVANRCLQINDATTQLPCTYDRALGLYGLGRIQETKATIETGLKQPAITEADATVKQTLQAFLADVNTALKTLPQPEPPPGDARPTQQRSSNQVASGESARVTGGVSCPPCAFGRHRVPRRP